MNDKNRRQPVTHERFSEITLELATHKEEWKKKFEGSPNKAIQEVVDKFGVSLKMAYRVCDVVGLPRRIRRVTSETHECTKDLIARVNALEEGARRLSMWAAKLSTTLDVPYP